MGDQTQAGRQFTISRTFNAPRAMVFKAWTEAERLAKWWGPAGMKLTVHTVDLKPGGRFHYCMTAANGTEMWGRFVYREISPPDKLSFVTSFSNRNGDVERAPFAADWPLEVLNIVTFTESGGRTTVTLTGGPINATEAELKMFGSMFDSMNKGFGGTFDQLDAYLASEGSRA